MSSRAPMRPFEQHVLARTVGMWVLAACGFLYDRSDSGPTIALCLVAIGAIQPMIAAVARRRSVATFAFSIVDIASAVTVGVVAPENLPTALLVLGTLTVWNAIDLPIRHFVVLGSLSVLGVGVLALVIRPAFGERFTVIFAVLTVVYGIQGFSKRERTSAAHRDLTLAIQAAGGLTHMTDLVGGVFEIEGDVEALLGWRNDEIQQLSRGELVHPDDLALLRLTSGELHHGNMVDRTLRLRTKDGSWRWVRYMARVVVEAGRPFLRGITIDVTKDRLGLDRIRDEAATDDLTGLRNRRALMEDLRRRESGDDHHLVLMDLNRFKEVNDTHGHEAGDQLLVVVANRLSSCMRPDDSLYRLGGDEFAIVVDSVDDVSTVVALVDRLAFEVAAPVEINGLPIATSLSAGIAEGLSGGSRASTMLRHADMAMYQAKRLGRTSVIFGAHLERQLARRVELTAGLEAALADGSLGLRYQPIVETATGRVAGAEGLARWLHPEFGMLSPYEFIEIVLQSEHAGAFTRAMATHAMSAAQAASDAGANLTIAVNIPVPVFEDPDFFEWFRIACAERGTDPAIMVFELAERDFHHTAAMSTAIDRFAEFGVVISVDDFGTGHATFERLRWRNVEQLKVDGSMVRGACENARDARIFESVVDLAADLGYAVVAEGVETVEQFQLLCDLDVEFVQGWLFSAELTLDALLDLVKNNGFVEHEAVRSTARDSTSPR